MDLAWLTLLALLLVVVFSCTTRVNPGIVAVVLAWLVARWAAPWFGATLGDKTIWIGFPAEMFLTLLGVSLLFAQAEANGTLIRVAHAAHWLCRGRRGLVPPFFFLFALTLGSAGPGNIAAAGLLAPVALATARSTGIRPFLMALMVGHGAIASSVSPFTASGVVASQKLADIGLTNVGWQIFSWNVAANALAALGGYLLLGGMRLWWPPIDSEPSSPGNVDPTPAASTDHDHDASFTRKHTITLAVIGLMMVAVVGGWAHVGMASFAAAALLAILGLADERETFQKIPWGVLVMVAGVSVLTSLLDKTGGTQRFAGLIGAIATPDTITPVVAFVTGIVSIYSSTTGVVLPAFLPMVKDIAAAEPGASPLSLALAVLVGGNLVDMSPLSTIGALCLAAAPLDSDRSTLFRQLLAWGFAMSLLGAAFSWACF